MKKTVVRPFEAGSLMLALVGVAFPAMLIYEAVSIILKGPGPERIVVIAVAAVLTYFISVSALKIIFMSKFTFYEDHFEVVYFDAFMDHAKTFYKPIPSHKVSVYYDDIEKFGSFESKQLRRNGRDDNNRLLVLAKVNGKLVPFTLPVWFQDSRNYFIINDRRGNGYLIDGKLYSVGQVGLVLRNLEAASGKSAVGGYPSMSNLIGLKTLFGFGLTVAIPLVLIRFEELLNPQHVMAYQSGLRTGYVVSGMFFGLSILFKFIMVGKSKENGDVAGIKRNRFMTTVISSVLFIIMATCFVISVMQ